MRLRRYRRGVLDTRVRGYDDLLNFRIVPTFKDSELVNPLETILGHQWANPFGCRDCP